MGKPIVRYCPSPDWSVVAAGFVPIGYVPQSQTTGYFIAKKFFAANGFTRGAEHTVTVTRKGDSVQIILQETATLYDGQFLAQQFGEGDYERASDLQSIVDAVLAGCATPSRDADGSTPGATR